jgi:RNA-directed DNA polymerase
MRTASEPQGEAMYVASQSDKDWLLNVQKKLYTQSWAKPCYVFEKLWGLVTDFRNLKNALARVARNRGNRTSGIDGITVKMLLATEGAELFLGQVRAELRSRAYHPSAVRRVLIPKPGKPGETRPLGIPTVKDRVVQAALKNILEPIFEADFFPCSYGFRLGLGSHVALEEIRKLLFPKTVRSGKERLGRLPYQWAIEGDIKGCFDNIDHHGLMKRVRRRIGDAKINQLVVAFLKAGVLSEEQYLRTDTGTPQGGILSPLLANIALSVIEERYREHVWPRHEMPVGAGATEIKRVPSATVRSSAPGTAIPRARTSRGVRRAEGGYPCTTRLATPRRRFAVQGARAPPCSSRATSPPAPPRRPCGG